MYEPTRAKSGGYQPAVIRKASTQAGCADSTARKPPPREDELLQCRADNTGEPASEGYSLAEPSGVAAAPAGFGPVGQHSQQ